MLPFSPFFFFFFLLVLDEFTSISASLWTGVVTGSVITSPPSGEDSGLSETNKSDFRYKLIGNSRIINIPVQV